MAEPEFESQQSGSRAHTTEDYGLTRTSLVVQWLRLHAPNAGDPGLIPGQGTRSHMPQLKIPHAATKIEDALQLN